MKSALDISFRSLDTFGMRLFLAPLLAMFLSLNAYSFQNVPQATNIQNQYVSVVNVNYRAQPATNQAGWPGGDLLLAANPARSYLAIQNLGALANTLIVKYGSVITTSNEGIQVAGGSVYSPNFVSGQSVYVKAIGGNVTAMVIEGQN